MPSKSGRNEIAALREQLLKQQREIEESADVLADAARPVELDQASVGRLSRMDAMQAQAMAMEVARRRSALHTRIQGALHRIEAGDYGFCFVCGDEIDIRRLQFDPTVTRCIGCKGA